MSIKQKTEVRIFCENAMNGCPAVTCSFNGFMGVNDVVFDSLLDEALEVFAERGWSIDSGNELCPDCVENQKSNQGG